MKEHEQRTSWKDRGPKGLRPSWVYETLLEGVVALAGVLVLFLLLSVTMEVCLRYFFQSPTSWVVEVSGYILLFVPFLVAGWVLRDDGHVRMDLFVSRVRPGVRKGIEMVASGIGLVVSVVLTYCSIMTCIYFYETNYLTPTLLHLPKWAITSVMPVGFFLMSVEYVRKMIRLHKNLN